MKSKMGNTFLAALYLGVKPGEKRRSSSTSVSDPVPVRADREVAVMAVKEALRMGQATLRAEIEGSSLMIEQATLLNQGDVIGMISVIYQGRR
jgi:hypothetical protein